MLVAGSAKQNLHDGDLTGILVLSANVINRVVDVNPENHVTLTKFDMPYKASNPSHLTSSRYQFIPSCNFSGRIISFFIFTYLRNVNMPF